MLVVSESTSEDFETTLKALEEVVVQLESGDLTLEEQLNAYEKGIKLSKHCSAMLDRAKLKVEELNKNE